MNSTILSLALVVLLSLIGVIGTIILKEPLKGFEMLGVGFAIAALVLMARFA